MRFFLFMGPSMDCETSFEGNGILIVELLTLHKCFFIHLTILLLPNYFVEQETIYFWQDTILHDMYVAGYISKWWPLMETCCDSQSKFRFSDSNSGAHLDLILLMPRLNTRFPWGILYPKGNMGDSHLHINKLTKMLLFLIVMVDNCSLLLVEAIVINIF